MKYETGELYVFLFLFQINSSQSEKCKLEESSIKSARNNIWKLLTTD